jgi:hypothetical protein
MIDKYKQILIDSNKYLKKQMKWNSTWTTKIDWNMGIMEKWQDGDELAVLNRGMKGVLHCSAAENQGLAIINKGGGQWWSSSK